MDTRTSLRITGFLAVALVGACTLDDRGAFARQGFRAVTQLIRTAAPAPAPASTITTGVRG